jgi:hypothetical protein
VYELIGNAYFLVNWTWSSLSKLGKISLFSVAEARSALLPLNKSFLYFIGLRIWLISSIATIPSGEHLQSFMHQQLWRLVASLRIDGIMVGSRIAPLLIAGVHSGPVLCPGRLVVPPADPKCFSFA